jgi:hypothetical protein
MHHFHKNGVDVMATCEGFVWPEHRTHLIFRVLMDEQYSSELSKRIRAGKVRP